MNKRLNKTSITGGKMIRKPQSIIAFQLSLCKIKPDGKTSLQYIEELKTSSLLNMVPSTR